MGFFKNQLRTIVQWETPQQDVLFQLYQQRNDELKNKSELILQPGQGCLLVYEGKVKDAITDPGSYTLDTANIPFISTMMAFMNSFETRHKTALYFFKTTQITGAHWGTADTIEYVDPVYHFPVGVNAFGNYSFSFRDALYFFEHFIGPVETFTIRNMEDLVNQRLLQPMAQLLASAGVSVMELDKQRITLSTQLEAALNEIVQPIGLTINDFRIAGTSYNNATREHIQKIAAVGADIYNAQQTGISYEQMQRLQAMREAAVNEGGLAAVGAGAGTGLVVAQEMMKTTTSQNLDPAARLARLKDLFTQQLITEEEYQQRKNEILKDL